MKFLLILPLKTKTSHLLIMKRFITSLVAMLVLGFASVCLFEASPDISEILGVNQIWFDALAVALFIAAACSSIFFEESIAALRHDKIR